MENFFTKYKIIIYIILGIIVFGVVLYISAQIQSCNKKPAETSFNKPDSNYVKLEDSLKIARKSLVEKDKLIDTLLNNNNNGRVVNHYIYVYKDSLILLQLANEDYKQNKARLKFVSLNNPKLNNYGYDSAENKQIARDYNKLDFLKTDWDSLNSRVCLLGNKIDILNKRNDNLQLSYESCTNENQRLLNIPNQIINSESNFKFLLSTYIGYFNDFDNFQNWSKGKFKLELETGFQYYRVPVKFSVNTRKEYEIKTGYIIF